MCYVERYAEQTLQPYIDGTGATNVESSIAISVPGLLLAQKVPSMAAAFAHVAAAEPSFGNSI